MHLVKRTVNRNLYDYVRLRTLQRTLFTHTLHIFLHVLTFLVSLMIPHTLLAPDTPQHEPSTLFFFLLSLCIHWIPRNHSHSSIRDAFQFVIGHRV